MKSKALSRILVSRQNKQFVVRRSSKFSSSSSLPSFYRHDWSHSRPLTSFNTLRCFSFSQDKGDNDGPADHDDSKSSITYYDEMGDEDYEDMAYESFDESFGEDDKKFSKKYRSTEEKEQKGEEHKRIWLDPSTKLSDRVNRFLNRRLGTMHPLDIKLASVDLIRECGKMNSFEGMKLAHDIMDRILEEKHFVNDEATDSPQLLVFIPERPFKVLMYGWANLCQKVPLAPQRMREILDLMIQEAEYDETILGELRRRDDVNEEMFSDLPSCQPTVDIYNTLLQGLVQASFRSMAGAGEAENVLARMIGQNRKTRWHTKPNSKSFTLVLTAFSKTRHVTSGDRAEAILRRMIQFHEKEKILYQEETGLEYDLSGMSNTKRKIVTPDTIAYSVVIQAHAQSEAKGSAEKALTLLSELLEQSSENPALTPDAFLFANCINAFAKTASKEKSTKARIEAAKRAEDILWLMVDELKHLEEPTENETIGDGEDSDEESDTDAPAQTDERASAGLQVSVVPFNACLSAWAQSDTPKSAARAEALLHKMLDPDSVVSPNVTSFNTCMQAWAKASRRDPTAPEKAEEMLALLTSPEGESVATADIRSYTTVMSAYAKSVRQDKTFHCRRLFESLLSSTTAKKERMTAVPFTVLLNAVAHSSDSALNHEDDDTAAFGEEIEDDPYAIALETYLELQEDSYNLGVQADHMFYATMLNVIEKHTSAESIERRQRIDRVFEDSCTNGQVSSHLLESLFRVCPSQDMLQSLLRNPDPKSMSSVNALPREWTRNVPPRFRKLEQRRGSRMKRPKQTRRPNNNHRKKFEK